MDESYGRCRTCRLCRHSGDLWVCIPESAPRDPDDGCPRYRPGCCGSCTRWVVGTCTLTGEFVDSLDVCSDFDPAGSFREPVLPLREDVLDAGLLLRIADHDLLRRFRYPEVDDVVAYRLVALHRSPDDRVGSLQRADDAVHHRCDGVDVRVHEGAGVFVSGLRKERVVRPVHVVLVQVVHGVHEVHGGRQLDEQPAEVIAVRVPRYILERSYEPFSEGPAHEHGVPAAVELHRAELRESLSYHRVVFRELGCGLSYRPPEDGGNQPGLRRRQIGLVVVQLPFRQDQRVGGHSPHELRIGLVPLEDAYPPRGSFEVHRLSGEAVEEYRVERHVVVHGERAGEAEPVPQLVAPFAVVSAVCAVVRRGQPAVRRDRVSEHRSGMGRTLINTGLEGGGHPSANNH